MMSTPKRPKLDFKSMLAGSREVAADARWTDNKIGEITSKLSKYQDEDNSESYRRLVGMCTGDTAEVMLVLRLGLEGLDCLRTAIQIVPEQYLEKRFNIISDIVNKILVRSSTKQPVTVRECEMLAQMCSVKVSSYMERQGSNYATELWALTEESGRMGYCAFLSPPIKRCVNPSCNQQLLHSYTPPTKVTVFEVSGPRPASKIALRCSKCKTNYNYSMFGNKTLTGERYYDMERAYVEASDIVFVSRELHQLFATLR